MIVGSGSCWFISSVMLEFKPARLQFNLFLHGHKMAAPLPRIKSCIPVRKHRAAQGMSLMIEEDPPHLHLITKMRLLPTSGLVADLVFPKIKRSLLILKQMWGEVLPASWEKEEVNSA